MSAVAPGLLRRVREELAATGDEPDLVTVAALVSRLTGTRGGEAVDQKARSVLAELTGFGGLQHLVDTPGVTDVLVNPDGTVYLDGDQGMRSVAGLTLEAEEVRRLAVRLVSAGGKRLDDASPYADVVLAGVRVHAVLPPVSSVAPALSLRRVPTADATLDSLLPNENDAWKAALARVIDLRLNFIVSGGTGAGKTTLLSAMLGLVPDTERILVVEDAAELSPGHSHCVSLASRSGNTEGAGIVALTDLVREALRMRPDRLVVGECRGEEVRDVLMALNTGHDGAGATLHANAPDAVGPRLVALGALGGWDARSTALQAAAAVDVVVHMARRNGQRRPVALSRLVLDEDRLESRDILVARPDGELCPGPEAGWFDSTGGRK